MTIIWLFPELIRTPSNYTIAIKSEFSFRVASSEKSKIRSSANAILYAKSLLEIKWENDGIFIKGTMGLENKITIANVSDGLVTTHGLSSGIV